MDEKECCQVRNAHHSAEFKKKINNRLNRIEGQIRGVKRMVDEDVYCDDILNQVASIKSAMDGVAKELLGAHMKSCVADQIREGHDEVIEELFYTIKKLLK
ncbi:metal-sensitive transcriptional regulator [uncultured Ilyobacter sp.]|uniref:metal-sensitive transcriptional regulator n=1 Tax=uncultured Ilyobacter sp. TaxID=544433 RepID=UPI0029F4A4EA|nr:metal-sensitive transcriptional regulator [uncultured Ilyobacter sp.]